MKDCTTSMPLSSDRTEDRLIGLESGMRAAAEIMRRMGRERSVGFLRGPDALSVVADAVEAQSSRMERDRLSGKATTSRGPSEKTIAQNVDAASDRRD